MEDSRIIELYWQRSENAITETDKKYGAHCSTVALNILLNKEDAEECVNDTWLGAWDAIPPNRPSILRAFLAKITRNLSIKRLKKKLAEKRGGTAEFIVLDELEECIGDQTDVEGIVETHELEELIRRFVRNLPERDGNIFVRRYFFTDPVASIAERYRISENHVMVILSRTRKKLKKELIKEGFICE